MAPQVRHPTPTGNKKRNMAVKKGEKKPRLKAEFSNAVAEKLQGWEAMPAPTNQRALDNWHGRVVQAVIQAARQVVGVLKVHNPKPWWNEEVAKAHASKAKAHAKAKAAKARGNNESHAALFAKSKEANVRFRAAVARGKRQKQEALEKQGGRALFRQLKSL